MHDCPSSIPQKETQQVTYLDSFLEFLKGLPDILIYVLLGLSAFVENVFPPIPGDTITAFGAFLVGTKRLNFWGVYLSTTLGSLSGFMFLFWVGRLLGRHYFIERDYWFFKAHDIIRAEKWFRKYGHLLVLLNRFFPGIRSAISIAGGIARLRVFWVTVLALLSSSVWNLTWISIGYVLGTNWETVRNNMSDIMARYNLSVLAFFCLLVMFLVIKKLIKNRGLRK